MQFKQLEWEDNISDGIIIASNCYVKIYDSVKIEFRIAYNKDENRYYLCSFGYGTLRRLKFDTFTSLENAKNAAFNVYSNEMCRMKRAIDSFLEKE